MKCDKAQLFWLVVACLSWLLFGCAAPVWAADTAPALRIHCFRGGPAMIVDDARNCFPDPPPEFEEHVRAYNDLLYTERLWNGTGVGFWYPTGQESLCDQAIINYIRAIPLDDYRAQRWTDQLIQMTQLCDAYVWPWGQR